MRLINGEERVLRVEISAETEGVASRDGRMSGAGAKLIGAWRLAGEL